MHMWTGKPELHYHTLERDQGIAAKVLPSCRQDMAPSEVHAGTLSYHVKTRGSAIKSQASSKFQEALSRMILHSNLFAHVYRCFPSRRARNAHTMGRLTPGHDRGGNWARKRAV